MMTVFLNSPVVQALVAGVLTVIAGIVGRQLVVQGKAIREVGVDASMAREQVVNSHSTNLRDDIDDLKVGIATLLMGQRDHTADILTLRTDISWERRERMDVAARVFRLEESNKETP